MDFRNKEHYPDPTAYEALRQSWKPLVFICSPFAGDMEANLEKAKRYMRFAVEQGVIPFAPHLLYPQILNENVIRERELGIDFGLVWLTKCRELWVFGDKVSAGMELEIEKAKDRNMVIRYFTEICEEV